MAEKNAQKYDKAISSLEMGVEGLKSSLAETKANMTSMDFTLNQLNDSNEELKKGLADVVNLLKRDTPRSQPVVQDVFLRDGDGSSSSTPHPSSVHGKISSTPATPTRFGSVHSTMLFDEFGRLMSNNPSDSAPQTGHPFPTITKLSTPQVTLPLAPSRPLGSFPSQPYYPYYPIFPTGPIPYTQTPPHYTYSVSTASSTAAPQSTVPQYPQPFQNPNPNPFYSPHHQPHNSFYKPPKVDFPKFEGHDPRSWVAKCEKYFQLNPTLDARAKVICAALYLEGEADIWFRSLEEEKPGLLWPDFVDLVCNRFSKVGYENLVGKFNKLLQKGSVEEYITQFDELRSHVMSQEGHHRESYYIDTFISGLKEEISQSLYNSKPTSLQEARNLARGQDYLLGVLDKRYKTTTKAYTPTTTLKPAVASYNKTTTSNLPPKNHKYSEVKRLTLDELNDKKKKGLCFHCDEKFVPGHDCKKKKLFLMVEEEEMPVADHELAIMWENEEEEQSPIENQDEAAISLNAMMGARCSNTVKIKGKLKHKTISILIDSGSTHNFISQGLVKQLKLPTTPCSVFNICVANGEKLTCSSKVSSLSWQMEDKLFEAEVNVIPLGGYDLILGVKWMKTVSPITFDLAAGQIILNWQKEKIKLTQDNSVPQLTLEHQTKKDVKGTNEELYFLVQITSLEEEANDQNNLSKGVQEVISQYEEVFSTPEGLPPKRAHDHSIPIIPGSQPVNSRPYRCPYFQKEEIEKLTRDMLDAGIIRNSSSPYASPVLLVKKKDNSWRMVIDYRALNSITIKNKYPIPVIEELLAELQGSAVFTKLDLRSGYHQIRVSEGDVYKTAFKTHQGHYEFLVMPFGLTNAPASFQGLMNDVFKEHLRKFVLVFFDDILIYSKSMKEHEQHLKTVFEILKSHRLFVKKSKCEFGSEKVEYLGHVISAEGVAADYSKIQAMVEWPKPTNIKALRAFLGLTGYYRRFVRNYGVISRPLTQLLKKGAYSWDEEANIAFEALKRAMTNTPVLALPDFSKPFIIETDACKNGVGAVMMQEGKPIAFMSKALSAKHLGMSTYEKELMAVIIAVQKWRSYLLGHQFIIKTDHEALKYIMEQRLTTGLQQKWLSRLLGYDYIITYRKGKDNVVADSLSRVYEGSEELSSITVIQPAWRTELQDSYINDSTVQEILAELSIKGSPVDNYSLVQGDLKWKGRYYVGSGGNLRTQICSNTHSNMEGGHSGITATLKKIEQLFYWPGVKKDVTEYVKACDTCNRNKPEHVSSPGLLQPIAVPGNAWEVISMDFVEGLPKSKGKDVILVIVDKLTKYCHLIPLTHPYTAAKVAQEVLHQVVKLHGAPSAIISDRDPIFVSKFWQELFNVMGTKIKLSTAYHPQTDGQTERVNQCIEMYLRCMTGQKPGEWANWIPMAEWWYNTTYHSSAGMTPYQALYCSPPPSITYQGARCTDPAVTQFVKDRVSIQRLLKDNLVKSQERMKFYADKNRSDREFQVGDEVYLKLQPYRQMTVNLRKNQKLAARYYGPYQVVQKIGKVAYKLNLPATSKIHAVFHVSQLKKKLGNNKVVHVDLPGINESGEFDPKPQKILDRKIVRRGMYPAVMVLVQWQHGSPEEATWESWDKLIKQFPDFNP